MTASLLDQVYFVIKLCVDFMTSVLVVLDYCLQILILSYAYFYQFLLTFLYVLMALFCLLIGAKSKLEKINKKKHQSESKIIKDIDTSYESNYEEESGYLTDMDVSAEHTSASIHDVYDEIDDNNNVVVDQNNNNAEVINDTDLQLLCEEDFILDKYFNLDSGRLVFVKEDGDTLDAVYHVCPIKDLVNKLDRLVDHGINDDIEDTNGIEDHTATEVDHANSNISDDTTENIVDDGDHGIEASVSDEEIMQEMQELEQCNNFDDGIECSADDKLDLFNVSNHQVD